MVSQKWDIFGGFLLSVRSSTQMVGWWMFFRRQWAINDMLFFFIGFTRIYKDGMQLYLAATENQFVDTGTAAQLLGGRIKSLLSPAASIHSVRWARSSYCGTNVGPTGRNANWSRTKWEVSRRKNNVGNLHSPSLYSHLSTAVLNIASFIFPKLKIKFLFICSCRAY